MEGDFRLGSWLVQPSLNTISRNGSTARVEPKAMEVLVCLARHEGGVVSKEEMIHAVWPDTFVGDDVLTRCISELRRALEDDPKAPRVIETIPKRGYRLVLPVQPADGTRRRWSSPYVVGLAGGLLIAVALLSLFGMQQLGHSAAPRASHATQLTNTKLVINGDSLDSPLLTDGSRLYFSQSIQGSITLQQLAVTGGEPATIPTPFESTILFDLSAGGGELLVGSLDDRGEDAQLWILQNTGGPPRRVGDIRADSAGWSPDARRIVYGKGSQLFIADRNGADAHLINELACSCSVICPRWSPDGQRLRFTREDYANQTSTLWEVSPAGGTPHLVLPDWKGHNNRKGSWSRDGKAFVFDDDENVWARSEETRFLGRRDPGPVQLSAGPLMMFSGVISPDGSKFFAVGERSQGEVLRYQSETRTFEPYLNGLSAEGIEFSRDGQWIVYVAYPEGSLWRSRVDGRERLQLTSSPLVTAGPRWSPDGSRVAFVGQLTGKPVNVYTVNADGSDLQALPGSDWRIAPSWSPDGKSLAFTADEKNRDIMLYDLETRTSRVLSSGKAYGPAWSPDGRYIVAATPHPVRLRLFDLRTDRWRDLKIISPIPSWAWSRDGKYIYLDFPRGKTPSIQRLRVADGRQEKIADLSKINRAHGIFDIWFGLDPNDAPMVLRDLSSQQIYAFDWSAE